MWGSHRRPFAFYSSEQGALITLQHDESILLYGLGPPRPRVREICRDSSLETDHVPERGVRLYDL